MKWAALITWVITALGGFGLLAIWLQRGGVQQGDQPGRRIRPRMIFTHLLLAATGLVLWIIYVASDTKGFAWVAFVLLLAVAGLGFGMLALWLQRRQARTVAAAEGVKPAEQHFPVPLVTGHGAIAATTLVLVLLAALGVGGS
jgi:manganese efflux pump family protein